MGDGSERLIFPGYMLMSRRNWQSVFESLEVIASDFPASNDLVHSVRDELMQDAPFSWIRSMKNKTRIGGEKVAMESS